MKPDKKSPYGLMIACDGYVMEEGIQEFWNMVVKENITIITSLNEEFGRGQDKIWSAVYQYFPDEKDGSILVSNNMKVTVVKQKTL